MAFTPFSPRQPAASARLPLTLISLDDWALATLTGADAEKYLQGQVTADVSQMTEHQHLLAAHCDPKGKMWSNLRLFRRQDGFAFIERRSLRDAQLTELKKYAVFSKVTIAPDDEHVLLGVAGFQARAALKNLFSELPDAEKQVVSEGATSILWFEHPEERFLLVTDAATAERVTEALRGEAQFNNSQQWLALNIEAGLPVIDAANSAQFIPQATNLQALGGISFKKGCYTGQEIVARMQYLGKLKRRLQRLSLAGGGELGDDDLVDQRNVGLHIEDLGGQVNRHGLGGSSLGCHLTQAPFAAERTRTTPPRGPGTAPLTRRRPFSTSTAWMVRFWKQEQPRNHCLATAKRER